ncbi:MAG: glutaredoxin 3 [endosymbiont of Galathealinum brachiosum]|uniref:Glutaredoxin n=1 Tax=endosymbiont of Galathealinum brachiosum TaxID=2200906 RepID=A0A370DCJ7_9GAMM|nr:MAG: glutaredoxin 3 [endosymbiont of Galathealinum brachiosum]
MPQANITVYYAPFCPYCGWAKQLLKGKNVEFTMINVNDAQEIRQEMEQRAGQTSVPQIFIGDTHVGGYDDMAALDDKGELDPLIAAN